MPSTTVSRRKLLASGGCLSLAIAGCAGESASESTVEGNGSDESTEGATVESTHGYESLFVRSDGSVRFIYRDEDRANEAAEAREDDASPEPYIRSPLFVVDEDDADELRIETDATREDEIRSFVAETDFESESIAIDQRTIEDCYRRHIEGIRAGGNSFHTDYCRSLKDPMTPCEAGEEVMEAVILRVHRPYNEGPSSRSSSESRSCPGSIRARDRSRGENEEGDQ